MELIASAESATINDDDHFGIRTVTIDISNDGHEADDEDKLEEPVGKLQVRGRPNLSVSQSDLA